MFEIWQTFSVHVVRNLSNPPIIPNARIYITIIPNFIYQTMGDKYMKLFNKTWFSSFFLKKKINEITEKWKSTKIVYILITYDDDIVIYNINMEYIPHLTITFFLYILLK
jgi:hypothetical protein